MKPHFQKKISIPVRNHLTRDNYVLKRIDEVEPTEDRRKQITSICNEGKVYSWLFRDIFENKPYTEDKAKEFFEIGAKGWSENRMFIFLLLSSTGEVAAAIDIKSSDLDNAEIGYWASESHRGCMTNTTTELLGLARDAGYRKLLGRTKKGNKDSANVLLRAGFQFDAADSKNSEEHDFYRVDLQKNGNANKTLESMGTSSAGPDRVS